MYAAGEEEIEAIARSSAPEGFSGTGRERM
jgi:hypothetical protein